MIENGCFQFKNYNILSSILPCHNLSFRDVSNKLFEQQNEMFLKLIDRIENFNDIRYPIT